MHLKHRVFMGFIVGSLAAACVDQPSAPVAKDPSRDQPLFTLNDGGGCEPWMVICDGETQYPTVWEDDGYEEVGPLESSIAEGDFYPTSSSAYSAGVCPSWTSGIGITRVTIPKQDGGTQTAFVETHGTWTMREDLGPNLALYNWPAGYHKAINLSGVTVQIATGRGKCVPITNYEVIIKWEELYGVNARYPRRRGTTQTSGGGGGGGGEDEDGCHTEWIVIQVDWGSGTYQDWWEGYAKVCDA
jgi:hypothetical protein